jgi:uncharacterized membrane-anchored protein YitT (DUF2179 family)
VKTVRQYFNITLGIIVLALGLYLFLMAHDIAAGGATGIAMLVHHFAPQIPVGLLMAALNAALFALAFIVLGAGFGLKTIYATLGLSGVIWLLERLLPIDAPLTSDLLLSSLVGTAVSGLGMAMIFNQGASSGGTDIIAKILNKYTHLDIGKGLLMTDAAIAVAAAAVFGPEKGLYALLAVVFNGFMIDYAIQGFNVSMQVMVMTAKPEAIAEFVMSDLGRGVTFLHAQSGYYRRQVRVVYTVVSRREFVSLKDFIKETDPKAFISVSQSHEVLGEGFKGIDSD